MRTLLAIACLALLCGCSSTPKVDQNGQPPPGWILTPKPPTPFCD